MKKLIRLFTLLLLTAMSCEDPTTEKKDLPVSGVAFILTSDYSTGSFALLNTNTYDIVTDSAPGHIHSDASVRVYGGRVYILNRIGRDNIQVLDPEKNYETVQEFSTGTSSNPHDIAFLNETKAYVSRYAKSSLLIINPATGETRSTIDLSSYSAEGMTVPHMSSLFIHENRLFVALQRLDASFKVTDYSSIVVIDTRTDTVVSNTALFWTASGGTVNAKNPYSRFRLLEGSGETGDRLLIACTGEFGYFYKEDGGIIAIDPQTGECLPGYLVSEEELGQEIVDFVPAKNGNFYIVTSDRSFHSRLLLCEPDNGNLIKELLYSSENMGALNALSLHHSGLLFVSDRNMLNPGVHIYDVNGEPKSLTGSVPVATGLPPVVTEFIDSTER
ncbi:MAG: hypothetical protein PF637_08875 [Spirochaetes bacterium]|jgi:hypothetical protein|nr:hypothetical protein [Spirochaetota bacterium]